MHRQIPLASLGRSCIATVNALAYEKSAYRQYFPHGSQGLPRYDRPESLLYGPDCLDNIPSSLKISSPSTALTISWLVSQLASLSSINLSYGASVSNWNRCVGSVIPSRTFRAAACFHVVTEFRGSNKMSQFPPVKFSPTPNFPVVHIKMSGLG